MRIQLTKDFRKVGTSYGLFQNLSGDANVELTENVNSDGIILRPFQIVTVNRTVWARKVSGAGTGVLAVLPFVDSDDDDSDDDSSDDDSGNDSDGNSSDNHHPPLPPPPIPHCPPPPPHCPPPPPHPHPHDDADAYVIKIPRALVERGQNKFVVDFTR